MKVFINQLNLKNEQIKIDRKKKNKQQKLNSKIIK